MGTTTFFIRPSLSIILKTNKAIETKVLMQVYYNDSQK